MGIDVRSYIDILANEGFQLVLEERFKRKRENKSIIERLFVFVLQSAGLVLVFDTYNDDVNSSKLYFNLRRHHDDSWKKVRLPFTGEYRQSDEGTYLAGFIDVREGVRFWVRQLKRVGVLITPWKFDPSFHINHYLDYRTDDYEQNSSKHIASMSKQRIEKLPDDIKTIVAVSVDNYWHNPTIDY